MKRLLIIGASGFGREVLSWAKDIPGNARDWEIGGFLDANSNVLREYNYKYPILADPFSYIPQQEDRFICAIGRPETKMNVCRSLLRRGASFLTLSHPSVVIGENVIIGNGCLFCPGAVITSDVVIGDFVTVNVHASIGHDAVVGEGCTLSAHVDITGFAKLGKGVFLGSHASVLPGAVVGDFSIIGAGSVVLKKVSPCTTVMGVPAKQISGF